MTPHNVLTFADSVLTSSSINPMKDCYKGADQVVSCLTSVSTDADPKYSPAETQDLAPIFELLRGKRLALLAEDADADTPLVDRTQLLSGRPHWVSVTITGASQLETFMLNTINWVNPIAAVISADYEGEQLTCSAILGFLIRAYDDEGYILVLLRPN